MSRTLALVQPSDSPAPAPLPLLETKLYAPRWHADLVPRSRLTERIASGRRLTVISAPAGFGKTTLLAGWLADNTAPVGWVSIDASENAPALFWEYVIRALQKAHPGAGDAALAALHSGAEIDAVLPVIINEIASCDDGFILVLDDYHVIDAADVHRGVALLLDRLPPRMQVVIATRTDPPLPLSRLRLRGELTELRPADLRFDASEAAAFLHDVMSLDISSGDVAALEARTEGWIAGLKLAALSMKGRTDIRGFIESFSGDHRYVADYLVEEVLQAQPACVQRFLLATSILHRLEASLCDAVTAESGSHALLEELERSNLFVVALDDRREWYRYHHLFADVLQAHAKRAQPELFRTLHERASAWYARNNGLDDAVRHALAAENITLAAEILERSWPPMDRSHRTAQWLARVRTLPDAELRRRPVLATAFAWALMNAGELEAAGGWLDIVAQRIDAPDVTISDEARFRTLPRELSTARVYHAQSRGETRGIVEDARQALDLMPADDHMARATATALVALAMWGRGDLENAYRTFDAALAHMRLAGEIASVIRGMFVPADIRAAQGRLRDAVTRYQQGLALAAEHAQILPVTDELLIGLAEIHCERNELGDAARLLQAAADATVPAEHVRQRERASTAMSSIARTRRDFDGAYALLEEAERAEVRSPLPRVRPFGAMRARIRIAQGRLDDAAAWAAGIGSDDEITFLREYELVTLARLHIARDARAALPLLERLLAAAEAGGRALVEILVLQSLVHRAIDDQRSALSALQRALELAEPEGYVRVFVDEGAPMRELLRHAAARGIGGAFVRKLLAAFEEPASPALPDVASHGMLNPLTTREHEVLRLIAAGLRNQQIADQLFISPATVKRHIANAYNKLGAGHRTEALVRAHELKLL